MNAGNGHFGEILSLSAGEARPGVGIDERLGSLGLFQPCLYGWKPWTLVFLKGCEPGEHNAAPRSRSDGYSSSMPGGYPGSANPWLRAQALTRPKASTAE